MLFDLIDLYDMWLDKQHLPKGYSADELGLITDLNEQQKAWCVAYVALWDADQEITYN